MWTTYKKEKQKILEYIKQNPGVNKFCIWNREINIKWDKVSIDYVVRYWIWYEIQCWIYFKI